MDQQMLLIPVSLEDLKGLITEGVREVISTLPESESSTPEEKPLTITEVCDFFGKSRQTIYDWMKRGLIPYYKISSRTYFLKSDLLNALQRHQLGKDPSAL